MELVEIDYENIESNDDYEKLLNEVAKKCFETEKLDKTDLYLSITLSDEEYIHKINNEFRQVDRATDVL